MLPGLRIPEIDRAALSRCGHLLAVRAERGAEGTGLAGQGLHAARRFPMRQFRRLVASRERDDPLAIRAERYAGEFVLPLAAVGAHLPPAGDVPDFESGSLFARPGKPLFVRAESWRGNVIGEGTPAQALAPLAGARVPDPYDIFRVDSGQPFASGAEYEPRKTLTWAECLHLLARVRVPELDGLIVEARRGQPGA